LHHIDKNKQNNSKKNLIGLCPNHHRMINNFSFRQEVFQLLKEKGYDLPLDELISSQNNLSDLLPEDLQKNSYQKLTAFS